MTLAERLRLPQATAKILITDIERLPGTAYVWEQKTRFVPASKFTKMPSTLCLSWQWYGDPELHFAAIWDTEHLAQTSWALFDQADIVIGWNNVSFDERHLRTDWLLAGLNPPRSWKSVDLFRVTRSTFGFVSNSLNNVCRELGLDTKSGHYDIGMAEDAAAGDVEAQQLMRVYNEGDVDITRQAYDRLLPWIRRHPHVSRLPADDPEAKACPRCGSDQLQLLSPYLAIQIEYRQYRCTNCGGLARGSRHARAANVAGL